MQTAIVVGFVGLLIGGGCFGVEGAVVGFFIGALFGENTEIKKRINKLEMLLKTAEEPKATTAAPEGVHGTQDIHEIPSIEVVKESVTTFEPEQDIPKPQPIQVEVADIETEGKDSDSEKAKENPPKDNMLERGVGYIFTFFTTGNVVAKIGVIILFFGVSFLLKFVAQRNLFPIEARLVCVAIGAIAMIVFGWRVRINRLAYGLILQGGGIGILYLNLFATAKHYEFMPITLAFGIMICLVILSVFLAVLQNSLALAGLGTIGGFLAPILMSTGTGNHVVLFSYYALLNAGIFGVAWFKAWRVLNLIGFAFTFVIGALWGSEYYKPEYFMSVEPFLVLSFGFYVSNSVLFAFRQPFHLKGYVDTTLVFGTPIVVFALQHGLVHNYKYGLAISALIMSAAYVFLATALWKRKVLGMQLLTESFLALGVVFGSLAIPLALDGRWTSVSWALEGVALVWVGIRQKRILARNFGLLLIVGANVSFLMSTNEPTSSLPIINGFYLSCIIIGMASLISSYFLYKSENELQPWERQYHFIMLAIGLIWWYCSGVRELDRQLSSKDLYNSILIFVSLSCIIKSLVANHLTWQVMKLPAIGLLPVMIMILPTSYLDIGGYHPFYRFGILSWILAFTSHYFLVAKYEKTWPAMVVSWWHTISMWLLTLILTLETAWWVDKFVEGVGTWGYICFGIVPSAITILLLGKGRKIQWPIKRFESEYLGMGLDVVIIYLILWDVFSCLMSGDPSPLSYVPIINPLGISQLFALSVIVLWTWQSYKERLPLAFSIHYKILIYAPAVLSFILFNAMIARTVHHFGGVSYTSKALFGSIVFHAAISISWSLVALFITFWATRKGFREVWFTGAFLLSLVVSKLFLVDLASSGTVARIVSFLAVGSLMLLIGYLSPLPASVKDEAKE